MINYHYNYRRVPLTAVVWMSLNHRAGLQGTKHQICFCIYVKQNIFPPFAHVWESHCLTVKRKSLTPFLSFRHQKHYRQTSLLIKVKHWQYGMNNDGAIQNAISTSDQLFLQLDYLQAFQHKFRLDLELNTWVFKISMSDLHWLFWM